MDRFGDDGVEGCSILVDVTKWKLAKPRDANLDLPHRVRNILSVIRVIARRTALRAETVEDYVGQLESRIGALARVQPGLITDPRTGVDLQMMISDEFLSHSIKEDRVSMEGPRIRLWEKAADTFGLAIHELAENAIKYGALANKTGMVAIRWRIDEGANALEFEWSETGARIAVAAPRLRGFGHELIERTLPYELAATTSIEFRPGGIRCTAVIPLSGRVSASPLIRGEF
jgi:two-component system CheB/CheR fusion protein